MTRLTNSKISNKQDNVVRPVNEGEEGEGREYDADAADAVTRRLADLKFRYDLLSNQLFHLKEFVSLIEFDPVVRNDMESFHKFLQKRGLEVGGEDDVLALVEDSLSGGTAVFKSGNNLRIRRRSFRPSTILRNGNSDRGKLKTEEESAGGELSGSIAVRLQKKMKEVDMLVQRKFEQLRRGVPPSEICQTGEPYLRETVKENKDSVRANNNDNNTKVIQEPVHEVEDNSGTRRTTERQSNGKNSTNNQSTGLKRKLDLIIPKSETENLVLPPDIPEIKISTSNDENHTNITKTVKSISDDDYDDDYYFTTSTDDDYETQSSIIPNGKRRKIEKQKKPHVIVKLSKPQQTVTNPYHVFHPKFKTLKQYLDSFKIVGDEDMTLEEYAAFIKEQRELVSKVRNGIKKGVLRYDPVSDSVQAVNQKDVQLSLIKKADPVSFIYKEDNKWTRHDYLVSHAVSMSKLFHDEQRARIARAKRVSQMIEQHFKHLAGSLERRQREEEKQKRLIVRNITQAVRKRWRLAERAYLILKRDEEERLKEIQGKKRLTKILEQSSQLLGAQLNSRSSEAVTSSLDRFTTASDMDEDRDTVFSSSDSLGSSSESELEAGNGALPDEFLSVEELRRKYSHLDDIDTGSSSISDSELEEHSGDSGDSRVAEKEMETEMEGRDDGEKSKNETENEAEGSLGDFGSPLGSDNDSQEGEESDTEGDNNSPGLSVLITHDFLSKDTEDDASSSEEQFSFEDDKVEGDEDISLTEDSDSDSDSDNLDSDVSLASTPKKMSESDVDTTPLKITSEKGIEPQPNTQMTDQNAAVEPVNAIDSNHQDFSDNKDISDDKPEQHLSVVDVPVPSLLRGTLRTYQKQGLNWLASLYNNNTNGILADEMGLGKTIQTISLLAYLACEKQNWGPHLIIVPTSVLLNWEMEFKRFCPGLKVLTYYGTPQQRKEKRKGWNKQDAFHVCIVSYQLVVQDQNSFRRKKWEYMVLDEAHNIKNFRSTRWQALLNFNTKRRLLLTGTPLQNNLAELWSLLYFLMPQTVVNGKKVSGFADLSVFQQWFGHHVDKIVDTNGKAERDEETNRTVAKLHSILRPYLLRRLKADVERQMPAKHEHIVYCKLSKRQRFLYDDFMSRAQTKEILSSGNFLSIVNCLMQLRKVCNHPDLFEVRPILTSFVSGPSVVHGYTSTNKFIRKSFLGDGRSKVVNLHTLNLIFTANDNDLTSYNASEISRLKCVQHFVDEVNSLRVQLRKEEEQDTVSTNHGVKFPFSFQDPKAFFRHLGMEKIQKRIDAIEMQKYINTLKCDKKPVYGKNLLKLLTLDRVEKSEPLEPLIVPLQTKILKSKSTIDKFAVLTPKAVTLDIRPLTLGLDVESDFCDYTRGKLMSDLWSMPNPFSQLQTKLSIAFPDKFLLQYDCGKLQKLAVLLQELKENSHRALIFTQMTKVLDILELFLSYNGYIYLRLDGATKVEDRQILTERFNSDERITVFILSSRSGGLGINLTGADTVIFYDSDWNPAMDKQCQDRCHRIGQTRDVHIYRFVSEHTIESNILKKANQKRQLDNVVIQEGEFTTDYFSKLSVKDLFSTDTLEGSNGDLSLPNKPLLMGNPEVANDPKNLEKLLAQAEDKDDVRAANLALQEVKVDEDDFNEDETAGHGDTDDEYEGTNHVEEYMIRMVASGYYR